MRSNLRTSPNGGTALEVSSITKLKKTFYGRQYNVFVNLWSESNNKLVEQHNKKFVSDVARSDSEHSNISLSSVSLPALMGVFDSKIERIEENEKTQKLILANISDEKPRYTSILLFKSETDLKDYLSLDRNAHLTAFHDAKRARDYLIET